MNLSNIIKESNMTNSSTSSGYMESSLTTPSDRDLVNRIKFDRNIPPLSDEELKHAMKDLNNKTYLYRRTDRRYIDPALPMQSIGLFSFIPSKTAIPDKNGFYGFIKLRGNYATGTDADDRSEYIIRNHDSYHQIFHAPIGQPVPCTESSKHSGDTREIDVSKSVKESISSSIKRKKMEDKNKIDEIREQENKLLDDTNEDVENDPLDTYITHKVKLAQLSWSYIDTIKKCEEMKNIILKTRKEIASMDQDSDYNKQYMEKYKRTTNNMTEQNNGDGDNFVQYLNKDAKLPF